MAKAKSNEEIKNWYEMELLPRLVAEGTFLVPNSEAKNLKIVKLVHEETNRGVDHFASVPYFTQMTLQDQKNPNNSKTYHLISKFIIENVQYREAMESDKQFYNEALFYNKIIPKFKEFLKDRPGVPGEFLDDIWPICCYADIDFENPDFAVVVMIDLRTDGFSCAKSTAELDLDHCLVAMRKLAKFHALSYAMKIEKSKDFDEMAHSFKECRYKDNKHFKLKDQDFFFGQTSVRGIDYLLTKNDCEVPKSYLQKLKKKVLTDTCNLMHEFLAAKEPLAVICHGDFCRNNILFDIRKTPQRVIEHSFLNEKIIHVNKPIDCKLFDYQTWRYATPAIDLTFFFYLNTTLELREKHLDKLLKTYYITLIETISLITLKSNSLIKEMFPYDLFVKDFSDHSLYGYIVIASFLPVMMVPNENPASFDQDFEKSIDEIVKENIEHGGEMVTKRLSEVVIDMYRRKFEVDN